MRIILSQAEIRQAIANYVGAKYPDLARGSMQIQLGEAPVTREQLDKVYDGYTVDRSNCWIQAVVEMGNDVVKSDEP